MSQADLQEHARYLRDTVRTAAYRAALAEVVRPGDRVLDLGAGTGLLGYLALDAGAGSVVAVESGPVIGLARDVAAASGYADRVEHVRTLSTELQLDRPADVVVCDQVGGFVHDAGVLGCFADARRRLLAPGGRLVPEAFTLWLAPVTHPAVRAEIDFWSSRPEGLDVHTGAAYASNTEWKVTAGPEVTRLAAPAAVATLASDHEDAVQGSATFDLAEGGRLDGLLGWFTARLSPSVSMTNDPWSPDRIDRWCTFYPMTEAVPSPPGSTLRVQLDLSPRNGVVTWNTVLERPGATALTARQSTFLGTFEPPRPPAAEKWDDGPAGGPRTRLVDEVLRRVDGTATAGRIADDLAAHPAAATLSRSALDDLVRRTLALCR